MLRFRLLRVVLIVALLFTNASAGQVLGSSSATSSFCDSFSNSSLNPGWTWVDPLGDSSYSLTANPGYLRLYTPDGGHDLYPYANLDAPRLVQSISGDFVVTTKVTINPAFNYQGAGLLIWQDVNNYLRLERTLVDGIDMWYRIGGVYSGIQIHFSNPTVYLRFQRSGSDFTASYSENGSSWTPVTTKNFPAVSTLQVGLVLINQWQNNPIWADFDFFEVNNCSSATIVGEARLDIGMPYSTNRGCSSPYVSCGGPYHGFYNGVCTDLAMDAYNAGVPFNIQNALYQDYLAHPGRYRYGTARNADDMRRYFNYNQQFLPHAQAYQSGDTAFFDWDANGLTDHVNVISVVDANGRPLKMVDATGTYSGNPSGLAFEHNWSSYYDQHIQGHGRLNRAYGATLASIASFTETLQVLRVAVDSPLVTLRLRDANGKSTSDTYDENLVASNIEAFIPYIPGGVYVDSGIDKVISVTQPLSNTAQYFIEVTGVTATQYQLDIQTVQDDSLTASTSFTQSIAPGETQGITLQLSTPGDVITFTASMPVSIPTVVVSPLEIQMFGQSGITATATVTLTETGNQQALNGVSVDVPNLMNQAGQIITESLLTVAPTSFDVPAGGSQGVQLEINLGNMEPGLYQGSLVIISTNGGTRSIPLSVSVEPFRVFLPLTLKNIP